MSSPEVLAARLAEERSARGLTLDAVARRSGLSRSYLSRVERGERQPSLSSLLRLASALDTTVSGLLGGPEDGAEVVFGPVVGTIVNDGVLVTPMSHLKGGLIETFLVEVPAADRPRDLVRHAGEESLYVVSGAVELQVGDDVYAVAEGTVAHFSAERPHWVGAEGGRPATLFLVMAGSAPADGAPGGCPGTVPPTT